MTGQLTRDLFAVANFYLKYFTFSTQLFWLCAVLTRIYRATLCASAVFAVPRCLSVCLSRWCIVSRRLNISSNFFIGPVAPYNRAVD